MAIRSFDIPDSAFPSEPLRVITENTNGFGRRTENRTLTFEADGSSFTDANGLTGSSSYARSATYSTGREGGGLTIEEGTTVNYTSTVSGKTKYPDDSISSYTQSLATSYVLSSTLMEWTDNSEGTFGSTRITGTVTATGTGDGLLQNASYFGSVATSNAVFTFLEVAQAQTRWETTTAYTTVKSVYWSTRPGKGQSGKAAQVTTYSTTGKGIIAVDTFLTTTIEGHSRLGSFDGEVSTLSFSLEEEAIPRQHEALTEYRLLPFTRPGDRGQWLRAFNDPGGALAAHARGFINQWDVEGEEGLLVTDSGTPWTPNTTTSSTGKVIGLYSTDTFASVTAVYRTAGGSYAIQQADLFTKSSGTLFAAQTAEEVFELPEGIALRRTTLSGLASTTVNATFISGASGTNTTFLAPSSFMRWTTAYSSVADAEVGHLVNVDENGGETDSYETEFHTAGTTDSFGATRQYEYSPVTSYGAVIGGWVAAPAISPTLIGKVGNARGYAQAHYTATSKGLVYSISSVNLSFDTSTRSLKDFISSRQTAPELIPCSGMISQGLTHLDVISPCCTVTSWTTSYEEDPRTLSMTTLSSGSSSRRGERLATSGDQEVVKVTYTDSYATYSTVTTTTDFTYGLTATRIWPSVPAEERKPSSRAFHFTVADDQLRTAKGTGTLLLSGSVRGTNHWTLHPWNDLAEPYGTTPPGGALWFHAHAAGFAEATLTWAGLALDMTVWESGKSKTTRVVGSGNSAATYNMKGKMVHGFAKPLYGTANGGLGVHDAPWAAASPAAESLASEPFGLLFVETSST
jgi:hypothetical protein